MGYDLHITRKVLWHADGPAISLDEWKALVMNDPEMRFGTESEGIWTSYSKDGRRIAGFHLSPTGNIVVKNPDQEIRIKMYQIAQKLGAKVQGDESELYDAKGDFSESSRSSINWVGCLLACAVVFCVMVYAITGLWGMLLVLAFVLFLFVLAFVVLYLIASVRAVPHFIASVRKSVTNSAKRKK